MDLKKFNYDDEKTAAKAPALYSSVHTAVIKKNDIYSFWEESKKSIFKEDLEKWNSRIETWISVNGIKFLCDSVDIAKFDKR